ncbi:hypothetical protein GCM10022393_00150 [Aquimarina addita]|uniref:DUF4174 domain-containing protein n=1 Tax=Aquimarina addita TaxID=870485 RepID=A0ABP7X7F4_9FLAO
MRHVILLLISVSFIISDSIYAQDIASHQWKNRVVLVISDAGDHPIAKKEMSEFNTYADEMNDRKLIVYQITPSQYKIGVENATWKKSQTLFEKFKSLEGAFEIILIGLDGGIKLRKSEFISSNDLFKTIDVMPMRRSEIRQKD